MSENQTKAITVTVDGEEHSCDVHFEFIDEDNGEKLYSYTAIDFRSDEVSNLEDAVGFAQADFIQFIKSQNESKAE